MNLKDELKSLKVKFGIYSEEEILSEDAKQTYKELLADGKPMPWDVRCAGDDFDLNSARFYRLRKSDLTDEETAEYLRYKELKMLRTIKNCVVFFTVLTVISLICGFIVVMGL